MYDLDKIIIIGDYSLNDNQCLETVVMHTDGMKILDLLYINDKNSISNEDDMKNELISELYDDMYDDDLNIVIYEAFNGRDALSKTASFIDDIYNKNSLLYYYNAHDENYDFLNSELMKYNGRIYLEEYFNIFKEGKAINKSIVDIMTEQGLKTEAMLKDSTLSFIYFLHALIEKMINK